MYWGARCRDRKNNWLNKRLLYRNVIAGLSCHLYNQHMLSHLPVYHHMSQYKANKMDSLILHINWEVLFYFFSVKWKQKCFISLCEGYADILPLQLPQAVQKHIFKIRNYLSTKYSFFLENTKTIDNRSVKPVDYLCDKSDLVGPESWNYWSLYCMIEENYQQISRELKSLRQFHIFLYFHYYKYYNQKTFFLYNFD